MREIQQLIYDGKTLRCPNHPKRPLEEAITESDTGSFSIVCTAPLSGGGNCMRSAQWVSREEMSRDLASD